MFETDLVLGNGNYRVSGNPDDPYYAELLNVVTDLIPLQAWVKANLPTDSIVIDAGGNIGVTALLLSNLLPNGHIHVFEALPENADFLQRNIEINQVTNCTINRVALGDRMGSVVMYGRGPASHVAMDHMTQGMVSGGSIPMTTLDCYMQDHQLNRLDFIKMDVEGFEPAVLDGASALLSRFRPPILMEFNSWRLTYVQGFHARNFINALWQSCDVSTVNSQGDELPAGGGSATRFLHDNVVMHGAVEDVLLRLKPGAEVPRKDILVACPPEPASIKEAEQLRADLAAIYASTSWKLTKPFRKAVQVIKNRRFTV